MAHKFVFDNPQCPGCSQCGLTRLVLDELRDPQTNKYPPCSESSAGTNVTPAAIARPGAAAYEITELDPTGVEFWNTPLERPLPFGVTPFPAGCPFADTSSVQDLTGRISVWMSNLVGIGENSTISRNDSLLLSIYCLSLMDSYSREDSSEQSTKGSTRSDMTLMYRNVPLVYVEEKHDHVYEAFDDLKRKFLWLAHYENLPFVFGIALSTTRFQVYLMTADEDWKQRDPIVNVELRGIDALVQSLVYAINIARVVNFFINHNLINHPAMLRYNTWTVRPSKRIRFYGTCVECEYAGENEPMYNVLKTFYTILGGLSAVYPPPHIELPATDSPFDDDAKIIRLKPIGVQRLPSTVAELHIALRHVLICLRYLHSKARYLHCDIRWPNVVVKDDEWYVVDCTECVSVDASDVDRLAVSQRIADDYVFSADLPWSTRHDYYQFGKLIYHCGLPNIPSDLKAIAKILCDKDILVVEDAVLSRSFLDLDDRSS